MTSQKQVPDSGLAINGRIRALSRRWSFDVPMSVGEIAELLGYSRSTVHDLVHNLEPRYRLASSTRRFLPSEVAQVLRGKTRSEAEAA